MSRMLIRTKIVATVGPASGDAETLLRLAEAGCDVFRINFSHGDDAQREQFLANIRGAEKQLGEPLAVMGDLCGPKIRVGPIAGGSMLLAEGQQLTVHRELAEGGPEGIATTLHELPGAVEVGQAILLDDGKLRLKVVEAGGDAFRCEVVRGGILASGKGVNLPETVLGLSALTEKDRRDAAWIAERDFDYVALSFVRSGDDVEQLRALLISGGSGARVVAKIEKPQALERIGEIVDAADAVMVARGDLGVEMNLPAVPIAQKRIARLCQARGKTCIIATQMLETMTEHATPTRAEVSDVANAVLDLTDAVMLSGETAVGKFPVRAVAMMNDIVAHTEAFAKEAEAPAVRVAADAASTTAALAAAVREIIAVEDIAAVAVFTLTGATARLLAKTRLAVPILALSPDPAAVRRMCLDYGVAPMQALEPEHTRDVLAMAGTRAVEAGLAEAGQKLVVLSGRPLDQPGKTNTLVVHTIP